MAEEETLQLKRPGWDLEKEKVISRLRGKHEIVPRTSDENDVLLLARVIYAKSRDGADPFLGRFGGEEIYFDLVSNRAVVVAREELQLKRHKQTREGETLDHRLEAVSADIILEIADHYEQLEGLNSKGLAETSSPGKERWKSLGVRYADFLEKADNFDRIIQEFVEAGAVKNEWVRGLRETRAKYHNRLNNMETSMLDERYGGKNAQVGQEMINAVGMDLVYDLDYALASSYIPKPEWRKKVKGAQDNLVSYLGEKGIKLKLPKVGDIFDPKWQQAIATFGSGEKVTKVVHGAFEDETSGQLLRDAQVEVGD